MRPADLHDEYERACEIADAGQHEDAAVRFRQLAELGYVDAWLALGNSLTALDRPSDAITAFQAAAGAGERKTFLNLGNRYQDLGNWSAAEDAYRQARAAGDPRGVMVLADLWRGNGDPAAAQDLLRQAASSGDPHAAGYLGVWLSDGHDADGLGVEVLLRQGLAVNDNARSRLAWILRTRGDLDEAEALLREGSRAGHAGCSIRLALLLEEDRGDLPGAERVLRAAAEAGELFAWNNLGVLLRDQRRLVEAEACFRHGASGDPLAERNLRGLRRTHRRQLRRAHRRSGHSGKGKNQSVVP